MALSTKSLGPGYIILNILRVMNIIGLLAVICGCVATLATTITITKVSSLTMPTATAHSDRYVRSSSSLTLSATS